MKRRLTISLLLVAAIANAATYYVRTDGDNANAGTTNSSGGAWRNVWYAAKTVSAGDLVYMKAGTFNEFVTNTVSGSAGNYITFIGELGENGEWLTIIDPSTLVDSGWVAAPEVGSGVWKQTGMAFTTHTMTISNKWVFGTYTMGAIANIGQAYTTLSTGIDLLTLPTDATLTLTGTSDEVTWWDSVGAFFCATGSVCYLRLRDGSDPNGLPIRCAPNSANHPDIDYPAIKNLGQSYIVWSNICVRGAVGGFYLEQVGSHHVTLVSNQVVACGKSIVLATGPHGNTIAFNSITTEHFGTTNAGAWGVETPSAGWLNRKNLYLISKFIYANDANTFDDGVTLFNAGDTNTITGNHIYERSGECVNLYGNVASPTTGTTVSSNLLERTSDVGLIVMEGNTDTQAMWNRFRDNNINLRCHHMDNDDETERDVFFYRNTCYLTNITSTTGAGTHVYFHYFNADPDVFLPSFWITNNSFVGGKEHIQVSINTVGSGGLTNTHFLNNIFSGSQYVLATSFGGANYGFWTNANSIGQFDYNIVTPPAITYPSANDPAWFAAHNIKQSTNVWASPESGMNFALPGNSQAINAGSDGNDIGAFEYPPRSIYVGNVIIGGRLIAP